MSRLFFLAVLLVSLAGAALAGPANAPLPPDAAVGTWKTSEAAPTGRWVTPTHDAVIQISQCGQNLCGRIVGMVLAPGEPVPKDWQGHSQCGLKIIQLNAGSNSGAGSWSGSVTDPRDGSVYHAQLRLDAQHNLRLRGYVGLPLFGQTQTWTKFTGAIAPDDCQLKP